MIIRETIDRNCECYDLYMEIIKYLNEQNRQGEAFMVQYKPDLVMRIFWAHGWNGVLYHTHSKEDILC